MLKNMKYVFSVFIILFSTSGVFAHSNLHKTTPQNSAVLKMSPPTIKLQFAKGIRLTKVQLHFEKNEPVLLDLKNYKTFSKEFILQNPVKETGKYRIEYRGIGKDGHTMHNEFGFEVKK